MNKYQEALDELIKYTSPINPEDVETLQELVDKSEYKAPVQVKKFNSVYVVCPTCKEPVTSLGNYCANCGQKIREGERG